MLPEEELGEVSFFPFLSVHEGVTGDVSFSTERRSGQVLDSRNLSRSDLVLLNLDLLSSLLLKKKKLSKNSSETRM